MESHPQLLDAVIEIVGAENVRESHLKMADHPFGRATGRLTYRQQIRFAWHQRLGSNAQGLACCQKNNLFFLFWRYARPDRLARCLNALRPYIKGSSPVFVTTLKVLMPNAELVGQIALVDIRHADLKVLLFSSYERARGSTGSRARDNVRADIEHQLGEMQDVVEEFLAAVPVELVLSIQDNRTWAHG